MSGESNQSSVASNPDENSNGLPLGVSATLSTIRGVVELGIEKGAPSAWQTANNVLGVTKAAMVAKAAGAGFAGFIGTAEVAIALNNGNWKGAAVQSGGQGGIDEAAMAQEPPIPRPSNHMANASHPGRTACG